MKRTRIFVLLALLAVLVSCTKGKGSKDALDGEWKMESYYGNDAAGSAVPADVYIRFDGGQFDLFQKLGGGHFRRYSGTYTYNGGTVSGTYDSGLSWASDYFVSFGEDGRMSFSQYVNDGEYVCIYVRTPIPDAVRADADDFGTVKSTAVPDENLWL